MFAESSDLYPDVPVRAPDAPTTFSHSLRLEVPNVDETFVLARNRGAVVQRPPADQPYGRGATIVDPFGHRWLITTPPRHATRYRQGDIANITMVARDAERAKEFYEAVLQLPFSPGSVPGSWNSTDIQPRFGIWSPENEAPEVQLCHRVDDIGAAVERVRAAGGTAEEITRRPYGLMAECADDQNTRFQLWQPVD
jgi:predicted enzyme related to lactoylglutathione lyase